MGSSKLMDGEPIPFTTDILAIENRLEHSSRKYYRNWNTWGIGPSILLAPAFWWKKAVGIDFYTSVLKS